MRIATPRVDWRFAYRFNPDFVEGRYDGPRRDVDRERDLRWRGDARDPERERYGYSRGGGYERDYDDRPRDYDRSRDDDRSRDYDRGGYGGGDGYSSNYGRGYDRGPDFDRDRGYGAERYGSNRGWDHDRCRPHERGAYYEGDMGRGGLRPRFRPPRQPGSRPELGSRLAPAVVTVLQPSRLKRLRVSGIE